LGRLERSRAVADSDAALPARREREREASVLESELGNPRRKGARSSGTGTEEAGKKT
jgi:hypothetical protein